MSGHLITFEGIDLSGKSVQATLLYERILESRIDVVILRDPGTTIISEKIRNILLDKNNLEMSPWTELLLYEAARVQMVEESIKPALAKGKMIVCDRLYDSTTAYQGYGRQLDLGLVAQANILGSLGIRPELTFLIDIDPQLAYERRIKRNQEGDRLEQEDDEFHYRVREGYLKIARSENDRILIIDGNRKISEIHEEIWHIVSKKFKISVT